MSDGRRMQPEDLLPSWQCAVQPFTLHAAQKQHTVGAMPCSGSPDAAVPHRLAPHPGRDQQCGGSKLGSLACGGLQLAKCAKPLSVSRHLCCSEALSTCDSSRSAASGLLDTTGATLAGAFGGARGAAGALPHPPPAGGASWYACMQQDWREQGEQPMDTSQEGLYWCSQHSEQQLALPRDSDMDWDGCTPHAEEQPQQLQRQAPLSVCDPAAAASPVFSDGGATTNPASSGSLPALSLGRGRSCLYDCAASALPAQLLLAPEGLGGSADDIAAVPPTPGRGGSSGNRAAPAATAAAADVAAADAAAGRKRVRDSPSSGPAVICTVQRSSKKLLCVVDDFGIEGAGDAKERHDGACSTSAAAAFGGCGGACASAAAAAASPEGAPGEEEELAAGISKLLCPLEPRYIIGTSLPIQGWFQFCRGCGIKTARTHDIVGHDVPFCHDCRAKYDAMVAGRLPAATACAPEEEPLSKWIPGVVAPGTRRLTGEQRSTICSAIILRQDQAWQQLVAASW